MATAQESATYAGSIANAELGPGGSCREELNDLIVSVFSKAMDAVDGDGDGRSERDLGLYLDDDVMAQVQDLITGTIVEAVYQATLVYAQPSAVAS